MDHAYHSGARGNGGLLGSPWLVADGLRPDDVAFRCPGPQQPIVAGLNALRGIAFAGERGISRVEVSVDSGETWNDATVHPPLSDFTWVRWQYDFDALPPRHTLFVRAADGNGIPQIIEASDPLPEGATGYHRRPVSVDVPAPVEESAVDEA